MITQSSTVVTINTSEQRRANSRVLNSGLQKFKQRAEKVGQGIEKTLDVVAPRKKNPRQWPGMRKTTV